jgi:hypothetical protein
MTEDIDPLKEDFRNFLYVVWKHLGLPDPTPVQYDIAYHMQHGPTRKIIMAFRGVGKSWIYSAFVCWRLYCNPDWKVEIISASKQLADSLSVFIKRLIREMPILQHLKPDPSKGDRDSNLMFDVAPAAASKDPSVKSVGITGQITGSRADEILADDIEVPNNSATQGQREKLNELVKEFDAIIKPEPHAVITYLGTPQTEDSLYNRRAEDTAHDPDGYKIRIWTAEVPADPEKYGDRLAPFIQAMIDKGAKPGTPTCTRFSEANLASRRASYGRTGYALQFMLDTALSDLDKFPLRLSDLIVADVDAELAPAKYIWAGGPDQVYEGLSDCVYGLKGDRVHRPMFTDKEHFLPYAGTAMYVDPSGRGADETAYAVVRYSNGRLFLVASGGFKGGYEDATLSKLASIAKLQAVNTMIIESNFGDGMFTELLKPVFTRAGYPCEFLEDRAKTAKEARIIDILEPLLNQHKLIVDPKVLENDMRSAMIHGGDRWRERTLTYQLTHITRERGALAHDDRLDALAGACNHFLLAMAKDSDKGVEEAQEAALDAMFEKFVEDFGGAPQAGAWLNGQYQSKTGHDDRGAAFWNNLYSQ